MKDRPSLTTGRRPAVLGEEDRIRYYVLENVYFFESIQSSSLWGTELVNGFQSY